MSREVRTLADVCGSHLLHTKWLVAPSYRVGHQWIEKLVRDGQSVVNLHPTTALRLALEIVGPELAHEGLALANPSIGPLAVDAGWGQLNPEGYLGRLAQSAELSTAVFESLRALRLAGSDGDYVAKSHWESPAKAQDIEHLFNAYVTFLSKHQLVDEAEVLRRAIAKCEEEPLVLGSEARVLVPAGLHFAGLERQFIDALPAAARLDIRLPAERWGSADAPTDIGLLAHIGGITEEVRPRGDGSVQLFRAVGEVNEIREVLRRALAEKQPLDEIELLHTDVQTYVPLIYGTARRYFAEPRRPDGVPVTFAEGVPTSLSRPGRALVAWLHWIEEGFPQRLLVDMIGEGLLDCQEDEDHSFAYLARLLRPIGIGLGAEQYLPKLDEQLKALGKAPPNATPDDDDDERRAAEAQARKRKGLKQLRKLAKQLLELSQQLRSSTGGPALAAAAEFLSSAARSANELDRYAVAALVEQIEEHRLWLDRLGVAFHPATWLAALPAQVRVLGSGPRPGHLHVAHVASGGHSGRPRTFVVGLDDRRFPGAALQDPVMLDRERVRLSPELATSAARLRHKINELAVTLARLSGTVTLSWSCQDLVDDRETFPSSVVLSAFRLISGRQDADLEALNDATAPPVSFAPATADKSLDDSERWLWRLGDEAIQGTNQVMQVESFHPHLARGRAAWHERSSGFGPYNGYVPQAGRDLNPLVATGPVLSASALETAGRCPLAFFFRNGLHLYRPEEVELDSDRWIDAAQFGSLLHDVFRRFLAELTQAGQRPDFERDHNRLAQILQEAVKQWRKDVPPPNENSFRMQYWQLIRTARIFLQAEAEFCQTSRPRFFEVALGLDGVADGSPLDDQEPSLVRLAAGKALRARGQIDRVDETGPGRYAVWDYKISSGYGYERSDPFRQGRRVQSVLYLHMIEAAVRAKLDPKAIVERFGYFFPSIRAQGMRIDWDAKTLSAGLGILKQICDVVKGGAFLATDDPDDCRYCDYTSICRDVNQVTSHSEELLDRVDLVQLTPFRELRRG